MSLPTAHEHGLSTVLIVVTSWRAHTCTHTRMDRRLFVSARSAAYVTSGGPILRPRLRTPVEIVPRFIRVSE